jgi:hypothetical protein
MFLVARASLRQSAHSGRSFCVIRRRPERRRMRAFPSICPNHGEPPLWPFWAVFRLSPAPFSDTTEPRPFWYGCGKAGNSGVRPRQKGRGFEERSLRRGTRGSKPPDFGTSYSKLKGDADIGSCPWEFSNPAGQVVSWLGPGSSPGARFCSWSAPSMGCLGAAAT